MILNCFRRIRKAFSPLIICQLLLGSVCYAQEDPKKDSLLHVLSIVEDTSKVNVLNALSALACGTDPNEAISYGSDARDLAETISFKEGLAYSLKNIGLGYYFSGNYVEASIHWEKSLSEFELLNDEPMVANLMSNLGTSYSTLGDDVKAVQYFLNSLKVAEHLKDSLRIATVLQNIGVVYSSKSATIDKASEFYLKALKINETIGYQDGISICTFDLGDIYFQKGEYDSALFYFKKSLIIDESTINASATLNYIGKIYAEKEDYQTAIQYQLTALEMAKKFDAKLEMAQSFLGLANTYKKQGNTKLAINYFEQAKTIALEIDSDHDVKDAYTGLAQSYAKLSDFRSAFKYQSLLNQINESIFNVETDDKIKNLQFSFELDKKVDQIEILEQTAEIEGLKMERQETVIYTGGAMLILLFLLGAGLYNRYQYVRRTKNIIEIEKDKSEQLLLNILPEETARELENNGFATPRHYDSVSVLFTDFKSFTKLAESLSSQDLVEELNTYFSAFDDIIEKHKLEKIKTIGDAYMCAGGIPTSNKTHPGNAVKAGVAMQEFMNDSNEKRLAKGLPPWSLRVGIHTGPVVAGVVGKRKYAYDIWGDTVNIASRMESNGEVGKVNISAATHELVKDHFEFTYRGKIEAKNKGLIDMYFVGHGNGQSQTENPPSFTFNK